MEPKTRQQSQKETIMLQGTRRTTTGFIDIDYDEGKQATYRGFEVTNYETGMSRRFNSGDPVRDCKEAVEYAKRLDVDDVCYSSSFDGFLMDGKRYRCVPDLDGWSVLIKCTRRKHKCAVCGQVVVEPWDDIRRCRDCARAMAKKLDAELLELEAEILELEADIL
jgi:hypothetical protein